MKLSATPAIMPVMARRGLELRGRKRMYEAALWAGAFAFALLIVTFTFSPAKLALKFDAPPGLVALLIVSGVIAVIGIAGFTFASFQIEDEYDAHTAQKTKEETKPEPPKPMTLQEEHIADYIKKGYAEPKEVTFTYDPAHGGPTPSQLPLSAKVISKKGTTDPDGVWRKVGAIAYANGATADFKILMLFDDETWQRGDNEHFEQKRRERPVHIEKALAVDYVEATTQGTDWVYCFGLASSDTTDEERNEKRSFDRAANLCRALVNLDYIKPGRGIGIGLGYANGEATNKRQFSRQRAAIIVGVSVTERVRITDLATSVAGELEVDGVVATSYSLPITSPFIARGIVKGPYNGIADLEPPDDDNDDFYDVGPTDEKN